VRTASQRRRLLFACLPLALPSRESYCKKLLLACMCDCAVRRPSLHLAAHCAGTHTHIRSFQSPLPWRCCQSPRPPHLLDLFPPYHPTTSTRPALTGVRVNVRLHQRTPSSLFFFLVGPLLQPSLESLTPYKYRPTVSVAVLLTITHSLQLTPVACDSHSPVNPSVPAQSTACCLVTRTCSFPTSRHCIHSRSRNL
jgi:hypothetical protein